MGTFSAENFRSCPVVHSSHQWRSQLAKSISASSIPPPFSHLSLLTSVLFGSKFQCTNSTWRIKKFYSILCIVDLYNIWNCTDVLNILHIRLYSPQYRFIDTSDMPKATYLSPSDVISWAFSCHSKGDKDENINMQPQSMRVIGQQEEIKLEGCYSQKIIEKSYFKLCLTILLSFLCILCYNNFYL